MTIPYLLQEDAIVDGRYKIKGLLGEGGFAVVYSANQININRAVAIKVLKVSSTEDPKLHQRLVREAGTAAKLRHPNVVTIFDVGTTEAGYPYIVMEPFSGRNLKRVLRLEGALEPERALKLFIGALSGIAAAHKDGVIHRDLKPNNLILTNPGTEDESLQIVDFGTARVMGTESDLSATGLVGTPAYMAPECIQDPNVISPSIDVYQMGLILIEALTGSRAVKGETSYMYLLAHIQGNVHMPQALRQSDLGVVIAKATHLDPQQRFANAGEFVKALENINIANLAPMLALTSAHDIVPMDSSGSTEWSIAPAALKMPTGDLTAHQQAIPLGDRGARRPIVPLLILFLLCGGIFAAYMMSDREGAQQPASNSKPFHTFAIYTIPEELEVINSDNGHSLGFSPVQVSAATSRPLYVQLRKNGVTSSMQRVIVKDDVDKVTLDMSSWIASLAPADVDKTPPPTEAAVENAPPDEESDTPDNQDDSQPDVQKDPPNQVASASNNRRAGYVRASAQAPTIRNDAQTVTENSGSGDATQPQADPGALDGDERQAGTKQPSLGVVDDTSAGKRPTLGTVDDGGSKPSLGTVDDGGSKPSLGTVDDGGPKPSLGTIE